jgi:hypothetical protein
MAAETGKQLCPFAASGDMPLAAEISQVATVGCRLWMVYKGLCDRSLCLAGKARDASCKRIQVN